MPKANPNKGINKLSTKAFLKNTSAENKKTSPLKNTPSMAVCTFFFAKVACKVTLTVASKHKIKIISSFIESPKKLYMDEYIFAMNFFGYFMDFFDFYDIINMR